MAMKKLLRKADKKELYYHLNGEKRILDRADPSTYSNGLTGDISSRLYGDCGVYGKVSGGLHGDISWLHGDVSGLLGNCTGIRGEISDCELTDEEREKGVNIQDLILNAVQ